MELKPDGVYRVVGRPLVGDGSAKEEEFERLTYWGTFSFFSPGDLSSQVPIEAFFTGRQWVLFKRDKFIAEEV
jgi:hypothetical protein